MDDQPQSRAELVALVVLWLLAMALALALGLWVAPWPAGPI